jgi:hypothetical protein
VTISTFLELVGYYKVETRITEIRKDIGDTVEGVKSLAALRRYNSTHSVRGTRYYSSQEDYKRDSISNSRRYQDPISINDRSAGSILEDLGSEKNGTLTKNWKECNYILFPILVFGFFCLVVMIVIIRNKICCANEEDLKEDDKKDKG